MQLINCERLGIIQFQIWLVFFPIFDKEYSLIILFISRTTTYWFPTVFVILNSIIFPSKFIYKKNFSLQILLWLPQLKTWFSNKNGKLYHNISTSSFPSRVWIINSFFGIFIFCMSNLVTLSMSKNFMDIVGKHKIIISHRLQGCLTWYSHTITTKQYIVSNHKIWP